MLTQNIKMDIIRLDNTVSLSVPTAVTIGFFDGVHSGHRHLLGTLLSVARQRQLMPMVLTFDRHPAMVTGRQSEVSMLTDPNEQATLLSKAGVQALCRLPFDHQMASMSAHDFAQEILKKRLACQSLVLGYNNRFGKKTREQAEDYLSITSQLGIEFVRASALDGQTNGVSSTMIRCRLTLGDINCANHALGYPYSLYGKVIDGLKNGRKIGFPTANLQPSEINKLVPGEGVYLTLVRVGEQETLHPAMTNIGRRPTFGLQNHTIETHLLDFTADLYGTHLTLYFLHRLRDTIYFSSIKELQQQLSQDREQARSYFARHPTQTFGDIPLYHRSPHMDKALADSGTPPYDHS